jgi:hypothetical protein
LLAQRVHQVDNFVPTGTRLARYWLSRLAGGQKEMLMPIASKKWAREVTIKKPSGRLSPDQHKAHSAED